MTPKPYLLFDAGGTLVFPDYPLTARIARQAGLDTSAEALAEAHARLFLDFDQHVAQKRRFPSIQYFPDLFGRVSEHPAEAQAAAQLARTYDRQRSLWTATPPWVSESLAQLAGQGYRMSVISNSDGRVDTILRELGLREYFEIVIDSHVVGVEKPRRKIFDLALKELTLEPQEAIYIGDIYYVDVWGANQAGIGALHLDARSLYAGWEGVHLPSIRQLPGWLAQWDGDLPQESLFPARAFKVELEAK